MGIYLPSVTATICVIVIMQFAYFEFVGNFTMARALLNQLEGVTILLAAIVAHGLLIRIIEGERLGRNTSIFLVKPLTTTQLAHTRIAAVLTGIIVAIAAYGITSVAVMMFGMFSGISPGGRLGSRPDIMLDAAKGIGVASAGAWIVLHYGIYLLLSIGLALVISFALGEALLFYDSPVHPGAIVLLLTFILLGAARRTRLRCLLDGKALCVLTLSWTVCATGFAAAIQFGIVGSNLDLIQNLANILVYASLFVAPLVTTPLWLERLRHR